MIKKEKMVDNDILKMSKFDYDAIINDEEIDKQELKKALEASIDVIKKLRKVYRKKVLSRVYKYHTTLGHLNLQVAECEMLIARLEDDFPELKTSLATRLKEFGKGAKEFIKDLPAAASDATQRH